ncbi:MAG: non-canonical purine NTP pyrophosphatase [Patescibacteria group bacterium]
MPLIIGTKNKAKIEQIKSALNSLNFDIQELPDQEFPEIRENGQTALDNARLKALAYTQLIRRPILSMDNALYLEGLADDRQPGTHVRHISNRIDRPSDDEIIDYYSKLISELGNKITGYWEYGVCVATPDGKTQEIVFRSPRIFVSCPSSQVIAGYPLESLQIDPDTGKYCSEMTQSEKDTFYLERSIVGQKLREFIINLPNHFVN